MNNERYIRQIRLPNVGTEGQQKLSEASVLVIGVGGLGNALLPYLVASGIGKVGVVDGDRVSLNNLHRQTLFTEQDVGALKVEVAKSKLQTLNTEVIIQGISNYLNADNAIALFKQYDVIVDATDRVPVRYLINDAAVLTRSPFVHAALYRFQVQLSVFNYQEGPTYRCLYPTPSKETQSCDTAGVMPSTVAIAGALQANEVMKLILGIGQPLSGTLLLLDTLTNQQHRFRFEKNRELHITEASFAAAHQKDDPKTISLLEAYDKEGWFVDVREPDELPKLSMENYLQYPLSKLASTPLPLEKDQNIFLFCQSGARSAAAFNLLKEYQFGNLYCLEENAPELSKLDTHEKEKDRIH